MRYNIRDIVLILTIFTMTFIGSIGYTFRIDEYARIISFVSSIMMYVYVIILYYLYKKK